MLEEIELGSVKAKVWPFKMTTYVHAALYSLLAVYIRGIFTPTLAIFGASRRNYYRTFFVLRIIK